MELPVTDHLRALRAAFQAAGFDIRLVGGCVRDLVHGSKPKDIDLCTDATPDEQIAIYRKAGIRHVETGLQHGTITAVLPCGTYEITSLRTESEHDGRHAKVAYTRDWIDDLSRRDLTINAMAMTFEGDLIDPFGGQQDLADGVIRFVGDPDQRIREDYLRILRYFRFAGRFAGDSDAFLDAETMQAVKRNVHGLFGISRERVWSEVSRILTGPFAEIIMLEMMWAKVFPYIGMESKDGMFLSISQTKLRQTHGWTRNPVTLMIAMLDHSKSIRAICERWKWSREETGLAQFLDDWRLAGASDTLYFRLMAQGERRDWVAELATLHQKHSLRLDIEAWEIPVFPVGGDDLIARGFKPGKVLGARLKMLQDLWIGSDYKLTKTELLDLP